MTTIQDATACIYMDMMKARDDAARVALASGFGVDGMDGLHFVQLCDSWNIAEELSGRVSITELRHGRRVLWRQWVEVNGMTLTVMAEWVASGDPGGDPPAPSTGDPTKGP